MTLENLSITNLRQPKIAILGAGYIGRYLHDRLRHTHNTILCASAVVDYHDPSTFYKFLLTRDVKIVINCSGYTDTRHSLENSETCWELNVVSPLNVLESCNKAHVEYIHIGTGGVFQGNVEHSEDDTPSNGLWSDSSLFYYKSKHAFETLTKNKNLTILRTHQPFSSMTNSRSIYTKLLQYINVRDETHSKTYLKDLGGFIGKYIDLGLHHTSRQEIYNVVCSSPLSISQIQGHFSQYRLQPEWTYDELDESKNCILRNSKANVVYNMSSESTALLEIL